MKDHVRRTVRWSALVVVLGLVIGFVPTAALAGTSLYELTENVTIQPRSFNADGTFSANRVSTSQLQGLAQLGTLLCPVEAFVTNTKSQTCTVTAQGTSIVDLGVMTLDGQIVSLGTGQGQVVNGVYAVVVQDTNAVDAPEMVVQTGTFSGDINLAPALLGQAPLGYITNGTFSVSTSLVPGLAGTTKPFSGTFRIPFAMNHKGEHEKPRAGRDAFYLGDDFKPIPVKTTERALGWPTVRFDVQFP